MFKLTFPREFDVNGKRLKIVNSQDELSSSIKRYFDGNNLYTTVYSFRHSYAGKFVYSSAIIDRILIDIDKKDNKGNSVDASEQARKITDYLLQKKYFFSINFSGRGYHIYIFTKPVRSSLALKNYTAELVDRTKAIIDTSVVGDLAREVRLINTINQKSGLYCIPIEVDEIGKEEQIATKPRRLERKFLYGETKLDLSPYEQFNDDASRVSLGGIGSSPALRSSFKIDTDYVISKLKKVPCIKDTVENESACWQERTLLLIFLKENGYSLDDAKEIIKNVIAKDKYEKSACTRNHASVVYSRTYNLPRCETINNMGLCPVEVQKTCPFYNKMGGFYSVLKEEIDAVKSVQK